MFFFPKFLFFFTGFPFQFFFEWFVFFFQSFFSSGSHPKGSRGCLVFKFLLVELFNVGEQRGLTRIVPSQLSVAAWFQSRFPTQFAFATSSNSHGLSVASSFEHCED